MPALLILALSPALDGATAGASSISDASSLMESIASTASNRKLAKLQYYISCFYPKKLFFQTKNNSNAWMTLKYSVVIFQASTPLQPQ